MLCLLFLIPHEASVAVKCTGGSNCPVISVFTSFQATCCPERNGLISGHCDQCKPPNIFIELVSFTHLKVKTFNFIFIQK